MIVDDRLIFGVGVIKLDRRSVLQQEILGNENVIHGITPLF